MAGESRAQHLDKHAGDFLRLGLRARGKADETAGPETEGFCDGFLLLRQNLEMPPINSPFSSSRNQ
jgi:hypothetical protein